MKKKLLSLALALAMCLGLLPATASAAQSDLPDWYFLFAIFKKVDADVKDGDGKVTHQTYTMPQDEIDAYREHAREFEEYMNSLGIMRAHVDVIEIDTTVTKLGEYSGGSRLSAEDTEPLLKGKADLDKYDHVFCIVSLNVSTRYVGVTGSAFANGTGQSCINLKNRDSMLKNYSPKGVSWSWPPTLYVHEYLHFMEKLSKKWGAVFNEHNIQTLYNSNLIDAWKECYTDIILNRVEGNDETGTGVHPAAWQYPPHVLRTVKELAIPSGVTSLGHDAFLNYANLTSVIISSSVTYLDVSAFHACTGLTRVTIPSSVIAIDDWAFNGCTSLKDVYYGGTEAQWKKIQISSIANTALTKANIHYNSLMADVKTTDWFAKGVAWALEKGVTSGTGGYRFSPNSTCTQGQILTFLWRACGSPEPAKAVSGSVFDTAAQWAKEQGVTGGAVSLDTPCTRADVVTYLWRLAGSPDAKTASFTDVSSSASYAKAVNWAVEQGVTSGVGGNRFGPDSICTRGQIVTFLYSALGK